MMYLPKLDPIIVNQYFRSAQRNTASTVSEFTFKCDAFYYVFKKVQNYSDGKIHTPNENFGSTIGKFNKSYFRPIILNSDLDYISD